MAAATEINPRIESEAQAFLQASGAEHAMAQADCRHFPTKRQMGICKMAPRSILTLPTENISYPISAKSSSTQLGSPPSGREAFLCSWLFFFVPSWLLAVVIAVVKSMGMVFRALREHAWHRITCNPDLAVSDEVRGTSRITEEVTETGILGNS